MWCGMCSLDLRHLARSLDVRRLLPQLYEHIRAELRGGGRVYIVCPLVEASSVAAFSEIKAVEVEFERLQVLLPAASRLLLAGTNTSMCVGQARHVIGLCPCL